MGLSITDRIHSILCLFMTSYLFLSIGCAELTTVTMTNNDDKEINGSETSTHLYVVNLLDGSGRSVCTGTMIAPSVVLTAAHCIISEQGLHPPSMIEIGTSVGDENNSRIPITSYMIREGWQMLSGGFDYHFDLALLYLNLNAPVGVISYSRVQPIDAINYSILGVGYGNHNDFQNSGRGLKRSVSLTITEASQFNFLATLRDGAPLDTCQGDSGGPALLLGAQGLEVLGVVSNSPTFCQGNTQYTSTASHSTWIDQKINAASEATPNPANIEEDEASSEDAQYTTCVAFNICLKVCQQTSSDQANYEQCTHECQAQTTATAVEHYTELVTCLRQFNCENNPNCQNTYCADQMSVCGFEVSEAEEGGDTGLSPINSCRELDYCDKQCRQSTTDEEHYDRCAMVCYERANRESIAQLNLLQSCTSQLSATCVDTACIEQECREEILACGYELSDTESGNNSTNPSSQEGTLSCTEVYSCMVVCSNGDDVCHQDCMSRANSTASGQIDALLDCYYGNTCNSFFDYECMSMQCSSTFGACIQ